MTTRDKRREQMATKPQVVRYWSEHLDQLGPTKNGDMALSEDACFACGDYLLIDRAHIEPHSTGGDGGAANLHLLCRRCHVESESLEGDRYWRWVRHMRANHYAAFYSHTMDRMRRAGFDWQAEARRAIEESNGDYEQFLRQLFVRGVAEFGVSQRQAEGEFNRILAEVST